MIWSFFVRGGWFVALMLAGAVVAGGYAWQDETVASRLADDGEVTSATVTDKVTRVAVLPNGETGSSIRERVLLLEFMAETRGGARTVTFERHVSLSEFEATAVGDVREVVYLPSDPAVVDLGSGESRGRAWTSKVVALLCLILALVTARLTWPGTRRAWRLATFGRETQGTVLDVREDETHVRLCLRYSHAEGRLHANWLSGSAKLYRGTKIGGRVTLCYDPADPCNARL